MRNGIWHAKTKPRVADKGALCEFAVFLAGNTQRLLVKSSGLTDGLISYRQAICTNCRVTKVCQHFAMVLTEMGRTLL
jgi:hypothetical protein